MGRTSDVPDLVKRAAKAMLEEGIKPTVAAIRARIGKGSNTTILKALKDWEQTDGLEHRVQAASSPGSKIDLREIVSLLASLLESNKKTQAELSEVKAEFTHFRSIHSDRLSGALTRMEDAYKILMVASDAARNESSRWKEKLDRQEIDFFNRENIYKQQIANLESRLGQRQLQRGSSSLTFLSTEEESSSDQASLKTLDSPFKSPNSAPSSSVRSSLYIQDDTSESPYE